MRFHHSAKRRHRLTQDASYERAIRRTVSFVQSELGNGSGAFMPHLMRILKVKKGSIMSGARQRLSEFLGPTQTYFVISLTYLETGNWEGKNTRMLANVNSFAESNK